MAWIENPKIVLNGELIFSSEKRHAHIIMFDDVERGIAELERYANDAGNETELGGGG